MRLFLTLTFLLALAVTASSEDGLFWMKTGTIGDSAPKARLYEIGEEIAKLADDAAVTAAGGAPFPAENLRGGHKISARGRITITDDGIRRPVIEELTVLNP